MQDGRYDFSHAWSLACGWGGIGAFRIFLSELKLDDSARDLGHARLFMFLCRPGLKIEDSNSAWAWLGWSGLGFAWLPKQL